MLQKLVRFPHASLEITSLGVHTSTLYFQVFITQFSFSSPFFVYFTCCNSLPRRFQPFPPPTPTKLSGFCVCSVRREAQIVRRCSNLSCFCSQSVLTIFKRPFPHNIPTSHYFRRSLAPFPSGKSGRGALGFLVMVLVVRYCSLRTGKRGLFTSLLFAPFWATDEGTGHS